MLDFSVCFASFSSILIYLSIYMFIYLSILPSELMLLIHCISDSTPYWNYLHFPRLSFAGTFRADVSTINNNYLHFDTEHFVQQYTFQTHANWNPKGSAEWSANAIVTSVCYLDSQCVTEYHHDKFIGRHFKGISV